LIDRVGKKIRVASEIASAIELGNVTFSHASVEEEKQRFDFVVSRAVMPLFDLVKIAKKNISPQHKNSLPNGLICLKGGELEKEVVSSFKRLISVYDLSDEFEEEFFQTKKMVHVFI
jgi:16S rRNA (guanine527-N7)-methyltransferase